MHPLEQLLEKPLHAAIIGYLATAPLRAHSDKELLFKTNKTEAEILPVLFELEEEGWLRSILEGKCYLFNTKNKSASELRARLLENKPRPQDDFTRSILDLGKLKAVFLSGMLTGQPHLLADLVLVGEVDEEKLENFLDKCKKVFDREINYAIFSEEEFIHRRDMLDRFIRDLFEHPHLTLVDKL